MDHRLTATSAHLSFSLSLFSQLQFSLRPDSQREPLRILQDFAVFQLSNWPFCEHCGEVRALSASAVPVRKKTRQSNERFQSAEVHCNGCRILIGPILWGHSSPLCHALSLLSSSSSWTLMRRRHATVVTPGEWQCKAGRVHRLTVAYGPNIFQMLLVVLFEAKVEISFLS